jgi:polar amino acid transport system substrate-binding protein
MRAVARAVAVGFFVALTAFGNAQAASPPPTASQVTAAPSVVPHQPLIVGITSAPPFVSMDATGYSGMAIDLWQDVADKLGLSYRYQLMPDFKSLLASVSAGKTDVIISDVTITTGRLRRMDFTQPWFDSGLRVMIDQSRHQGVLSLLRELWVSGHIRVYLWIVGLILLATVILTLLDRRFDEEFTREWRRGFAESLYHVMSIATSGKAASHKQMFGSFGRVFSAVWMVCGLGVVAYVTSSVTSVMTASTIANQINSVADLTGKTVGVISGTVGEAYCQDAALAIRTYPNLAQAVQAMLHHKVHAIVGDAGVLEYYDNSHPDLPITEVGAIFRPSKYGFATPTGSPLTQLLSVQIVADQESGFIAHLKARYFGIEP